MTKIQHFTFVQRIWFFPMLKKIENERNQNRKSKEKNLTTKIANKEKKSQRNYKSSGNNM
jgi:hypothetical protein